MSKVNWKKMRSAPKDGTTLVIKEAAGNRRRVRYDAERGAFVRSDGRPVKAVAWTRAPVELPRVPLLPEQLDDLLHGVVPVVSDTPWATTPTPRFGDVVDVNGVAMTARVGETSLEDAARAAMAP